MILPKKEFWIVLSIFLFALVLRIYGISYGLPYKYNSDEEFFVLHALKFGTGDLNPRWFLYPSLYMYLLFILYGFFFAAGKLLGLFQTSFDFIVLYFTDPSPFYLIGRMTTAFLGSLTAVLIYFIGKRLFDATTGMTASFFLAAALMHVQDSHYITTDVPATFLITLALYFCVRILKEGTGKAYVLAGLVGGLSISTKYNAYLVVILIGAAHFLRNRGMEKSERSPALMLGMALAGLGMGFFLGTPYSLLDLPSFWPFVTGHLDQARAGWINDPSGKNYYWLVVSDFLYQGIGPALLLVCMAGLFYAFRGGKGNMLLLSFPLVYFLINGGSKLNFPRYWNPVLPFLFLLGAHLAVAGIRQTAIRPRMKGILLFLIPILLVAHPTYQAIGFDCWIQGKDTRTMAKEWIERNIPPGTKIALDKEGPQVHQNEKGILDERQWQTGEAIRLVEGRSYKRTPAEPVASKKQYYDLLLKMPVREPSYHAVRESTVANRLLEFYERNGFQYIVVAEGFRKVALQERGRYPKVADFFEALDRKYPRIKEFRPNPVDTPGPAIYIYKINFNAPAKSRHSGENRSPENL